MSLKQIIESTAFFKWAIYFYPPYWGTGVQIATLSADYRHMRLKMPLRFYNKNYFGTQFGGSLYAMSDPFYCLMLSKNLGRDYIVWDKAAKIEFIKPGKGAVFCDLHLSQADLDNILQNTQSGAPHLPIFYIDVVDGAGTAIAKIEKTLYVRAKRRENA